MATPIDYSSIVSPISKSMSMVADHMLRAPAIQYRLQQERLRLAQQDELNQLRGEDFKASARKTNAEAEDIEGRNAAKKWLEANDETFSALVDAGQVSLPQMNEYARAYARATGKDMKDVMDGLIALAAARKGASGAPPAEVAAMTPGSAATLAGAGLRADATRDAAKIRAESGDDAAGYETVTEIHPATEGTPGTPGVPAQYGWFGRKIADAIPATEGTPGTPERRVTTRRKLGSAVQATAEVPYAEQTMEGDDAEMMEADPGVAPESAPVATAAKVLDKATAAQILEEVGFDKDKARQLARQRGYTF